MLCVLSQSQLLLLQRQFCVELRQALALHVCLRSLGLQRQRLVFRPARQDRCYSVRVSLVCVAQPDMHTRAALSVSRLPFVSSQRFKAAVFAWRLPDVLYMPHKPCLATLGTGLRGLSHPRPLPGAPGPHAHAPAPGPAARPQPQRPRAPPRAPQRPPLPCDLSAGCLLRSSFSLRT